MHASLARRLTPAHLSAREAHLPFNACPPLLRRGLVQQISTNNSGASPLRV